MHTYIQGDRFQVIADSWAQPPNGRVSTNVGRLETGVVRSIEYREPRHEGQSGYDVVTLEDGRVFERADIYYPPSPYGWNERTES